MQLVRVRGTDFEPLASAALPLRGMLESPELGSSYFHAAELREGGAPGGAVVARVNVSLSMLRSITPQVHHFLSQWLASTGGRAAGRGDEVARVQSVVGGAGNERTDLMEPFVRKVGYTYSLTVKILAVSGVKGGGKRHCYAMHQFLDFPPSETDTLVVTDESNFSFMKGTASYPVPCIAAWDKKLLSRRLDVCIFDDSPALPAGLEALEDDGLIGSASVLMAPLLTHRGCKASRAFPPGPLRERCKALQCGFLRLNPLLVFLSLTLSPQSSIRRPSQGVQ